MSSFPPASSPNPEAGGKDDALVRGGIENLCAMPRRVATLRTGAFPGQGSREAASQVDFRQNRHLLK
jgi:hypothetical protein